LIGAILTDIEGTTSSIAFVHKVLFPYARERLAGFVAAHRNEPAVRRALDDANAEAGGGLDDDAVVARLLEWIDADRKSTPLKALQGMVWADGYAAGHISGHVYSDAARWLRDWHGRGIRLYVFSSGSVQAQKLLFGHSDHGDLTPLFSGYFDTATGAKRDPEAYRRIAAAVRTAPDGILFLSDIREELDAAHATGMHTAWLVRDAAPGPAVHPQAGDFADVAAMFGLE
jgi:enolase-phosphatase E1